MKKLKIPLNFFSITLYKIKTIFNIYNIRKILILLSKTLITITLTVIKAAMSHQINIVLTAYIQQRKQK